MKTQLIFRQVVSFSFQLRQYYQQSSYSSKFVLLLVMYLLLFFYFPLAIFSAQLFFGDITLFKFQYFYKQSAIYYALQFLDIKQHFLSRLYRYSCIFRYYLQDFLLSSNYLQRLNSLIYLGTLDYFGGKQFVAFYLISAYVFDLFFQLLLITVFFKLSGKLSAYYYYIYYNQFGCIGGRIIFQNLLQFIYDTDCARLLERAYLFTYNFLFSLQYYIFFQAFIFLIFLLIYAYTCFSIYSFLFAQLFLRFYACFNRYIFPYIQFFFFLKLLTNSSAFMLSCFCVCLSETLLLERVQFSCMRQVCDFMDCF